MTALRLVHLTYAGSNRPTASVEFDPALTVIYGSSDTGKSFIVESIAYMLGGPQPKPIPEAEGYSQILLGLQLPDGSPITLLRAPGSNTLNLHRSDLRGLVEREPEAQLTATHTARSKRSLSLFLLEELGLSGTQIRKNDAGATRGLNLTDLVHLALVTETRMWQALSPVFHSTSASGGTAAKSVMKLVLTGEDDPPIDAGPNPVQRRVNKGKIVLLDHIVLDLHTKLTSGENPTELRERLQLLQTTIEAQTRSLREEDAQHRVLVTDRMQAAQERAALEERLTEVHDLLERFGLLERQYRSDLERLAMVGEAGSLLGFFQLGACVFCGADPEHQKAGHREQETTQLHAAVQTETAKTEALLTDLLPTMADLRIQLQELGERHSNLLHRLSQLDAAISVTEDRLEPMREHVKELLGARSSVERDLELHQRISELEERRSLLDGEGAVPLTRPAEHIPTRVVSAFDTVLQNTLDSWHVPAVEFPEYDQIDAEIRAGGRDRSGRGKGVRSVLHSAFTAALARYCLANSTPHPGFIVLDSPVVTYREPVGEDISITSDVVTHFYRDMAEFPRQAIIIENGDPPAEVLERARVYQFTAGGSGRAGFFPLPGV